MIDNNDDDGGGEEEGIYFYKMCLLSILYLSINDLFS
jgi:hypothetical protein